MVVADREDEMRIHGNRQRRVVERALVGCRPLRALMDRTALPVALVGKNPVGRSGTLPSVRLVHPVVPGSGKLPEGCPFAFATLEVNLGLPDDRNAAIDYVREKAVEALSQALASGNNLPPHLAAEAQDRARADGRGFLGALRSRQAAGDEAAARALGKLLAGPRRTALEADEVASCVAAAIAHDPRSPAFNVSADYWTACLAADGPNVPGDALVAAYVVAHFPYGVLDPSPRWSLPMRLLEAGCASAEAHAGACRSSFDTLFDLMDAAVSADPELAELQRLAEFLERAEMEGALARTLAAEARSRLGGGLVRLAEGRGHDLRALLDGARRHVVRIARSGKGMFPATREEMAEGFARLARHPGAGRLVAEGPRPLPHLPKDAFRTPRDHALVSAFANLAEFVEREVAAVASGRASTGFAFEEAIKTWREHCTDRRNPTDLLSAVVHDRNRTRRVFSSPGVLRDCLDGRLTVLDGKEDVGGDRAALALLAAGVASAAEARRDRFPPTADGDLGRAFYAYEAVHSALCSSLRECGLSGPARFPQLVASWRDACAALPVPARKFARTALAIGLAQAVGEYLAWLRRWEGADPVADAAGARLTEDFLAWCAAAPDGAGDRLAARMEEVRHVTAAVEELALRGTVPRADPAELERRIGEARRRKAAASAALEEATASLEAATREEAALDAAMGRLREATARGRAA
jgi:hypothetical protein